MSSNAADTEVFVYTGPGGDDVPQDVARVRVDPSVTSIPYRAFYLRKKLTEVELCEVRVEALAFKLWRNHIKSMIHTATFALGRDNSAILLDIRGKFSHFEDELTKLKEVTTILELALWKMKISENSHQDLATHDSNVQSQDWVTCGADVVIGHVVPFLINTD